MKQSNPRLSQSTELPHHPEMYNRPSASEAASVIYGREEELCFCRECRKTRHEFALSDSGEEQEHIPSFRASPKFQDAPTDSLVEFLRDNGLTSLLPILQEHEVTLTDLFLLSRDDFAEMKIPIGPRNRLISIIQRGQNASLSQSKLDLPRVDSELDSPKQQVKLSVKPATPEKPPLHSLSTVDSETPWQLRRKQLNEEVQSFLQEVEVLLERSEKKEVAHKPPEPVPQVSGTALSLQQLELLKSVQSGKETIEKGLESLQRSIAELKENRDSRGASPVLRQESSRGGGSPPKTKLPLNMKKALASRLK